MDERAFWANVDKSGDCWEWTGARLPTGYGSWGGGRRLPRLTHRIAWILTHGSIPDGLFVLHKCDNRPCVRPSHLFVGTQGANVADCIAKGRFYFHVRGEPVPEPLRGDVLRLSARGLTQRQIASQLHIKRHTVRRVLRHEPTSQAA